MTESDDRLDSLTYFMDDFTLQTKIREFLLQWKSGDAPDDQTRVMKKEHHAQFALPKPECRLFLTRKLRTLYSAGNACWQTNGLSESFSSAERGDCYAWPESHAERSVILRPSLGLASDWPLAVRSLLITPRQYCRYCTDRVFQSPY